MKLNHLPSTTQPHSGEATERARQSADERIHRVEAAEGVEGDRQRSLNQELTGFDPRAIGPFGGGAQVMQGAREVAARLTLLGNHADALLKLRALALRYPHIDDQA